MPDPTIYCSNCSRPVPGDLLPAVYDLGTGIAYCSGRCMREHFQSFVLGLCRESLTPQQFADLTADHKPQMHLPALDTTNQIREALQQVTDGIINGQVTNKQASLLLYALQTALANLKASAVLDAQPEPEPVHHAAGFTPEPPCPTPSAAPTAASRARSATPLRTPTTPTRSAAPSAPSATRSTSRPPRAASKSTTPRTARAQAKASRPASIGGKRR